MSDRDASTMRVIEELKRIYKTKILPLEKLYMFDMFFSPFMSDAEFDSKPQVMLIGQYSVGKTTFIRYLLGANFPGMRIGPEPTTDRFTAIMNGPEERTIPGNALAISADLPYRGLQKFGMAFLNRFEGSQLPSEVLRNITLIDTPGVLAGEKQRLSRGYDFESVCSWFASRCDLIILLFDAHKLDISDEFRKVLESLKGNDDKIRCILNKADQVDRQKLLRVYGALMWSIGKVMKTPEVLRVYVGSFWDQPLQHDDNRELFEMEEADLMNDLRNLPCNSAVRKINELVKRVRVAKVHAYILGYLREQMPMFMGKEKKKQKLIDDLGGVFRTVMKRYNLAPGDFPPLEDYKSKLAEQDFTKFSALKVSVIEASENTLSSDIPRLMEALPRERREVELDPAMVTPQFDDEKEKEDQVVTHDNPFGDSDSAAVMTHEVSGGWCLDECMAANENTFASNNSGGFITGGKAKELLMMSGIDVAALRQVTTVLCMLFV
jgi:EH domain-containing protein 1